MFSDGDDGFPNRFGAHCCHIPYAVDVTPTVHYLDSGFLVSSVFYGLIVYWNFCSRNRGSPEFECFPLVTRVNPRDEGYCCAL